MYKRATPSIRHVSVRYIRGPGGIPDRASRGRLERGHQFGGSPVCGLVLGTLYLGRSRNLVASSPFTGSWRSLGRPPGPAARQRVGQCGPARRLRHGRRSGPGAVQQACGVAAEDLLDMGGREPAVAQ